jgi:hypothetical protein
MLLVNSLSVLLNYRLTDAQWVKLCCCCFLIVLLTTMIGSSVSLSFANSLVGGVKLPTFRQLVTFRAALDFVSDTGKLGETSMFLFWKDNGAGYALAGLEVDGQRGMALTGGIYRWTFRLARGSEPHQLPSSPVFRISLWDVTTGECLVERSLHQSDFQDANQFYDKYLFHSTSGREGHRFEPRVYWEDFVDGFIDWVRLEAVEEIPSTDLAAKALQLDRLIQAEFLDPIPETEVPGLLVARRIGIGPGKEPTQRGDSATWTGLYTASQTLRLRAYPHDAEARLNMENGFRALHRLHEVTNEPGIVARYADTRGQWTYVDKCGGSWRAGRVNVGADGQPFCRVEDATCVEQGERKRAKCPNGEYLYEEWSKEVISEDIYAAFTFAVGIGYPLIADPALKAAIGGDFKAIARHIVTNDFKIIKAGIDNVAPKKYIHFNPYLPEEDLRGLITQQLEQGNSLDQISGAYLAFGLFKFAFNFLVGGASETIRLISLGCIDKFPFIPADLLPQITEAMFAAIQRKDIDTIVTLLPEFVENVRTSLAVIHRFLGQASGYLRSVIECVGRLPNSSIGENYRDLLRYIDTIWLPEIWELIDKIPEEIPALKAFKFDASSALAAAHILSVTRVVAPEEFETPYYQHLLGGAKDLLTTIETWEGAPETLAILLGGDLGADKSRGGKSDTAWRSFAALYNLIQLEPRSDIRERFRLVLERKWAPHADEGNALYDVMRAASGKLPGQFPTDWGMIGWGLANMPAQRQGYSHQMWNDVINDISLWSGGLLSWDPEKAEGIVRDPAPVAIRALHQLFIWQRNPRKIGYNGDADGVSLPSVDYLLPYFIGRAAGMPIVAPPTPEKTFLRPTIVLKNSGEVGLTIGGGYDTECKTLGGAVFTPAEIGALPGPYGEFVVGHDGIRLAGGHVQVRMLTTRGRWSLKVAISPEKAHYWAEVCRGALHVDGREGAEVKFVMSIAAPASTQDNGIDAQCPAEVVANSGEQGVTIGSGSRHKTKELHVQVDVPSWHGPLRGQMGQFLLNGDGYDDGEVRVRVVVYRRVEHFELTKTPTGVHVYAKIYRPGGFNGGGEIKVVVDLFSSYLFHSKVFDTSFYRERHSDGSSPLCFRIFAFKSTG